ncbi:small hydrophobic protein [Streptomyces sp. CA-111067]|uniref:small hydrophobic protein n=1 Tax=Streptomyces sp. CA-111067 TaxID=3240046 RepID=UPI003D950E40
MTRRTYASRGGFRGAGDTTAGGSVSTLGLVGVICAVAGFFVLGIVLGPVALVCGWLVMGRTWRGRKPVLGLIATILGALDLVIALLYLAQ